MEDSFASLRLLDVLAESRVMQGGMVHRKCIPWAILVQPLRGSYVVSADRRRLEIASGEFVLVAADMPVTFDHRADAVGGFVARWLHVQAVVADAIDPCALAITPHRITGAVARRIGDLLGALLERTGARPADRFFRLGLAASALGEALADASDHPRSRERLAAATRFAPLGTWMRANLHRPLSIDDIAQAAALSRSRLHALTAEHLRRPPMAWLKELRLSAAARLLLTTGGSVGQVAAACGFANPFHFSREFTRRYRVAPSRYRDVQDWGMAPASIPP
ncbi:MAG: helix-turn-helix transcriptional regulator [Planctomycetes bacterium]|nr:helix-turn-helix transcriptional regulator [Planctomycetota bacterium]